MRINEVRYTDARPVDGYGPDFFRIGGQVYTGPTLLLPTGVTAWGGFDDRAALIAAADQIDVLFVGTGAEIALPPAEFRTVIEDTGIGVEPMASPAACRTYNVLLSEGRRIGMALFPI